MTSTAIAVIGALSICNLVLTMTVVRQVRRHGEQLASRRPGPGRPQPDDIPAGQEVPDFAVATLSGEQVSRGGLAGERSLIAFFLVRCEPCKNHLPEFREYASTAATGPAHVLAVLIGNEDDAGDYIEGLAGVASIAMQAMRAPMVTAFSVTAFPTFYQLDDEGRVAASGGSVRHLERANGSRNVPAGA